MKKIIFLFVIFTQLIACNKKELKVPKVAMQGEEEVANHSIIWMFLNEEGNININENNRISSTNWFFNIDKHLKLSTIIPDVNRLAIKHNKKSPHNTKPMKNYFTYVNSLNNHLSFYQFDSIQYRLVKKAPVFLKDTTILHLKELTFEAPKNIENAIIQPIYNGNLSFQDYFLIKARLKTLHLDNQISKKEYILLD